LRSKSSEMTSPWSKLGEFGKARKFRRKGEKSGGRWDGKQIKVTLEPTSVNLLS